MFLCGAVVSLRVRGGGGQGVGRGARNASTTLHLSTVRQEDVKHRLRGGGYFADENSIHNAGPGETKTRECDSVNDIVCSRAPPARLPSYFAYQPKLMPVDAS